MLAKELTFGKALPATPSVGHQIDDIALLETP